MTIDMNMVAFISGVVSMILGFLAIALSIVFYIQAKTSEKETAKTLERIQAQAEILKGITDKHMTRLIRHATEQRPIEEILTIISTVKNIPDSSMQLHLQQQEINALTAQAIEGYIGSYYYSAVTNCYLKSFQPNQDTLVMFEAIVLDVWENKKQGRIKEEFRIEKGLKELEATKDKIFELLVKETITEEVYKQKTTEISNEITVKRIELNETRTELNDIEACLNFAKFFMSNIADLWINGDLDLKQRFQTLLFPDKIFYEDGKFRTTKTSIIFKQLQSIPTTKSDLVAPTGFEPVFTG